MKFAKRPETSWKQFVRYTQSFKIVEEYRTKYYDCIPYTVEILQHPGVHPTFVLWEGDFLMFDTLESVEIGGRFFRNRWHSDCWKMHRF